MSYVAVRLTCSVGVRNCTKTMCTVGRSCDVDFESKEVCVYEKINNKHNVT